MARRPQRGAVQFQRVIIASNICGTLLVEHIAPEAAAFSPESRSTIVRFLRTIVQMSRELDEGFIRFVAFHMANPGQDDGRDLNLALRCV
jgi:hypothetical protein